MEMLKERGADVSYYDPFVPVVKPTREHSRWAGTRSINWKREAVAAFDVVVIATNHRTINYEELATWAPCIVDTRNAMAGIATQNGQVWKA